MCFGHNSSRQNGVPHNMTSEFTATATTVAAAGRGRAAVACRRPCPESDWMLPASNLRLESLATAGKHQPIQSAVGAVLKAEPIATKEVYV